MVDVALAVEEGHGLFKAQSYGRKRVLSHLFLAYVARFARITQLVRLVFLPKHIGIAHIFAALVDEDGVVADRGISADARDSEVCGVGRGCK